MKNKKMEKIQTYKEAFEILLKKLKHCGNLTHQEKFDEDMGEIKVVRSMHLIEIIETYMVEILDNLKDKTSKQKEDMN